ncbi:hypothetical protein LAZ67_22001382 [Cordylochernes scorpioides]|uniref:DH domain-containing protein n=1 Tax=Cordylochernes scorpioides TaxID=51811 RepID=A0ABY6LSU5_9ARAC|nr:hypothetical protein LAZ67_22001382 [Cordylochernes scorpioides]
MFKMKLEELREKNIPASDDLVYTFNQRILEAMSSAKITYSIKGGPRKSKPWFDKDCYDMKKLAKESLKKYRKTNRLEDRECYASSRKKYLALLDLKRKGFDNEKQEILRNAKDSKTFWKTIALYKSTSIIQGEISIQDWLNFYRELMTTEKNLRICNLHNVISQNDPILDSEITNADIYKEIAGLRSNKACGPDGIPNEVLKTLPDSYILLLKQLYNSVMTTGKYPAIWTNSTIHPIFKNGYKNSPSNYREFGDIHLLLYADDIAIIGESRINLQKKIKILKEYLDENLMTLNESKSKIMVFRNGGVSIVYSEDRCMDTERPIASRFNMLMEERWRPVYYDVWGLGPGGGSRRKKGRHKLHPGVPLVPLYTARTRGPPPGNGLFHDLSQDLRILGPPGTTRVASSRAPRPRRRRPDPFGSVSSRKSILECDVTAYDLIKQSSDDDLSDNAVDEARRNRHRALRPRRPSWQPPPETYPLLPEPDYSNSDQSEPEMSPPTPPPAPPTPPPPPPPPPHYPDPSVKSILKKSESENEGPRRKQVHFQAIDPPRLAPEPPVPLETIEERDSSVENITEELRIEESIEEEPCASAEPEEEKPAEETPLRPVGRSSSLEEVRVADPDLMGLKRRLSDLDLSQNAAEHIYEELPDPKHPPPPSSENISGEEDTSSIFKGASRADILDYLHEAKDRGWDELPTSSPQTEDATPTTDDEEPPPQQTPPQPPQPPPPLPPDQEEEDKVAEVERNDSGVGSETCKPPPRRPRRPQAANPDLACADCDGPLPPGITPVPLACPACEKNRAERRRIIHEFVDTELKYGTDLRIIKEEFYRHIDVAGLLTPAQMSNIFLNLDQLVSANRIFSRKLTDALEIAQEQGDEDFTTVNIGKLFLECSSMLHAFESYCVRHSSASLLLSSMIKEKDLLRVFLVVSRLENTRLRRMDLATFLMVPVQRVTKYPLLLNRLYRVTPFNHQDGGPLQEAQRRVERHLELINQFLTLPTQKIADPLSSSKGATNQPTGFYGVDLSQMLSGPS